MIYPGNQVDYTKYVAYVLLTDLTRISREPTWALTRVAVDKVCARATILTGVGRTLVDICPQIYIM